MTVLLVLGVSLLCASVSTSQTSQSDVWSSSSLKVVTGDQSRSTHNRIIYRSSKAPAPIGPYNQAVRVDDVLYISGQIGLSPDTGEMVESLQEQTVQALDNMAHILQVNTLSEGNKT